MPKMKHGSLATQTRRVTTHSQTYRERCARQLQDNMDGANKSEPGPRQVCSQLPQALPPRSSMYQGLSSVHPQFSVHHKLLNSFQHTRQYAPGHDQLSLESSVLSTISNDLQHSQQYAHFRVS